MEIRTSRAYWKYSRQLEEFISKYKRRPMDIKFWPYGPYWPSNGRDILLETPTFVRTHPNVREPFYTEIKVPTKTVDTQETPYNDNIRWMRSVVVYDCEKTPPENIPVPTPSDCCPSLVFESRFESGNLRQARRVGQFEYELVLKTDLYTNRHTQWYFFRVENVVPGITYKFRIVNLLKRDSLYNYGMRPLIYSEEESKKNGIGWMRTGHHILYSRNMMNLQCPLLTRGTPYFMLEWQMEFPHTSGCYYLAHGYPYTFTDLKDDLESLLIDPSTNQWLKREVLCETRAGNSCFLLTITDFNIEDDGKKVIVVSARVHPGETQASWMVRGVIHFLTGKHPAAEELRRKYIFKIIPMLNPDGVIVGNYRCSLVGKDLNRNYRRPVKTSCPTVWHVKTMIEDVSEKHQVLLYCDLHGHSRKHNVFMYGNNTCDENSSGVASTKSFLNDRLFPWIIALHAPDKFSFPSCKFRIRRCKESTGRVVMWRQLRIAHSFTMEAAFSGSVISKDNKPCHFSIRDYQDMGQTLCLAIYDFHRMQTDEILQAKFIFSLTRQIAQQLQSKNPTNTKVLDLKNVMRQNWQKTKGSATSGRSKNKLLQEAQKETKENVDGKQKDKSNTECYKSEDNCPEVDNNETDKSFTNALRIEDEGEATDEPTFTQEMQPTREEEKEEDEDEPILMMDDCLHLLVNLNVTQALMESDSSDSDSDSDPEVKPELQKWRSKQRKSRKKKRSRSSQTGSKSTREERTIGSGGAQKNATSSLDHQDQKAPRQLPHFVSKFDGRTNGGIPCFSEERCLERIAAKRMVEIKQRCQEQQRAEENSEETTDENNRRTISFLSPSWTQQDIQPNIQDVLNRDSCLMASQVYQRPLHLKQPQELFKSPPHQRGKSLHNLNRNMTVANGVWNPPARTFDPISDYRRTSQSTSSADWIEATIIRPMERTFKVL